MDTALCCNTDSIRSAANISDCENDSVVDVLAFCRGPSLNELQREVLTCCSE